MFPFTTLLYNFDYMSAILGDSWSGSVGVNQYEIVNGQVNVGLGGPIYWNPASFGVDEEAFVTLTKIDDKAMEYGLLLKVQSGKNPKDNNNVIEVIYNPKKQEVRLVP